MLVCICNGFSDRDVSGAIRDKGACSVAAVHRCIGTAPMCGRCTAAIRDILADESRPSHSAPGGALGPLPEMAAAG